MFTGPLRRETGRRLYSKLACKLLCCYFNYCCYYFVQIWSCGIRWAIFLLGRSAVIKLWSSDPSIRCLFLTALEPCLRCKNDNLLFCASVSTCSLFICDYLAQRWYYFCHFQLLPLQPISSSGRRVEFDDRTALTTSVAFVLGAQTINIGLTGCYRQAHTINGYLPSIMLAYPMVLPVNDIC